MDPSGFWQAVTGTGRRACYERWVRDHARDLYHFAYRLAGDAETAEDLVQETFYHAWRGRGRLRRGDRARAWLFQILRNRHARWVRATVVRAAPAAAASAAAAPGEALADRESLQAALDGLDDRFKLPLLLVFVQELTCRQAAEQLDLPLGTVLSRIHRARRHLRRALADEGEPLADRPAADAPPVLRPHLRLGGEP